SYYRVQALGAFGDSAWSNIVHAVVSRSALGTIQAENFESQSGGISSGPVIGTLDNGKWVEYRDVDFGGGGADQFNVSIAVPDDYAGQRIEVHLDGVAGQLVGTMTVASTGSWTAQVRQSIAITPTTGLHDVYLVFRGRIDGTRMDGVGAL